ncbi:UDP-GlcNAc:betaGal beta-1,3-N-acetylglucosaminyltransferase 7 [Gadus chalcogrammus]|uniref:UDP-GlcNAc:betaGal beta-1,3-N-acetylglucosaminyltransferase 7 n=1 Tax=Gadus chalcogrammus TaxID=1042646 RepID=UPI0024C49401|nr:UDP-GlcNAc:betaGal beta-1,3-N-acetylglucosaminyltransferase 7 [Gadus chalcogrammus]
MCLATGSFVFIQRLADIVVIKWFRKRQKMRIKRDRWRMYKGVSVMFFLAVVALTVVQRGTISGGEPFQLERRQARPDVGAAAAAGVGPPRGSSQGMNSFWKAHRQEPSPEAPPTPATPEEPLLPQGQSPATWDVTASNCTPNHNISGRDWFKGLQGNFQEFLTYRHCRYFPMLINHPEKCSGRTHLLMVVKSVVTQHDRREVIRRTWGKERAVRGKRVKTLFLLGKPSNEEERANHQKLLEFEDYIYGDILQWDFLDSFFNLTLKETHFLKWFDTYCGQVRYIFKGDDDVFVSVDNILEYLEGSGHAKGLLVGDVLFKAKPIRRKSNKYYIPEALYNKTFYPPYAGGGGFVMDGPLVRRLHWASETLELFPIDDVFLGMCLEVLQVTPVKHDAFKTFGLVKNKTSKLNKEPCFFKGMIVVHKLLPAELLRMWNLVNSDLVCSRKVGIL